MHSASQVALESRKMNIFQNLFLSKYVVNIHELAPLPGLSSDVSFRLGRYWRKALRSMTFFAAYFQMLIPGAPQLLFRIGKQRRRRGRWYGCVSFRIPKALQSSFLHYIHLFFLPRNIEVGFNAPGLSGWVFTYKVRRTLFYGHPLFARHEYKTFLSRWRISFSLSFIFSYSKTMFFNSLIDYLRYVNVPIDRRQLDYVVDWDRYVLYSGKTWENP